MSCVLLMISAPWPISSILFSALEISINGLAKGAIKPTAKVAVNILFVSVFELTVR